MNAILKSMMTVVIVASLNFSAQAADVSVQDHMQRLERMKGMTPEQRAREREALREEVRNMTPEQRALRRRELHERIEKMSPEERREMRERMRVRWLNMAPEERAARRREMHERFENMSPEERQQFRLDMRGDTAPQSADPAGDAGAGTDGKTER